MRTWTLEEGVFQVRDSLPLSDRAIRYGMSVFETVGIFHGRVLFWKEHLDRLRAAVGDMDLSWSDQIPAAVERLLSSENFENGVLRIYVTAGDGGPLASADAGRVFLLHEDMEFPDDRTTTAGYRVGICRAPYVPAPGGWKTGNYWQNVRALTDARKLGLDEALLFNAESAVVSASMANVFFLRDGILTTPPRMTGARDGVVRAWVMQQLDVSEELMRLEDLSATTEAFLTNSRLGIMPVCELDGHALACGKTIQELVALYREKICLA